MAKHILTVVTVQDDQAAGEVATSIKALTNGWQVLRGGVTSPVEPTPIEPRYLWVLHAIAVGNFDAPNGA